MESMNKMPAEERMTAMCGQVLHMMVSTPFDKRQRRLEICLRGDAGQIFENVIYPLIKRQKGFRVLIGQAPKSALERQLQEYLDGIKSEQFRVSKLTTKCGEGLPYFDTSGRGDHIQRAMCPCAANEDSTRVSRTSYTCSSLHDVPPPAKKLHR